MAIETEAPALAARLEEVVLPADQIAPELDAVASSQHRDMVGHFIVVVGDDERLDARFPQPREPRDREGWQTARVGDRRVIHERNAHLLRGVVALQRVREIHALARKP